MMFLFHLGVYVVGTFLFVLLFRFGLFSGGILFYRGIALLAVISIFLGFLLFTLRLQSISTKDIVYSVIFLFLSNLVIFTHIPVTAERSLSVFLLGYMNTHEDAPITIDEMTNVFEKTFIREHGGISQRFDEQRASGTVTYEGKGYRITPRGRLIVRIYTIIADLFLINKSNLSQQ